MRWVWRLAGIVLAGLAAGCASPRGDSTAGLPKGLYADPVRPGPDAVCLIDMTLPRDVAAAAAQANGEPRYLKRLRARLAGASGLPCEAVHFTAVTSEINQNPRWKAIVIMGFGWVIPRPDLLRVRQMVRTSKVPMIGFCGGGQIIAEAFGSKVGPIRKLRTGELDPHPAYHPGFFKEWGFMPVRVLQTDPLFAGLGPVITVGEWHSRMMMSVPVGFDRLAETDECPIQAIKQRGRLVYAVQFHPEHYDRAHPDGKVILQNFFRQVNKGKGAK